MGETGQGAATSARGGAATSTTTALRKSAPLRFASRPALIQLEGVEKTYRMGRVDYRALRGIDLAVAPGELVAIVGPSGSARRRS